LLAIEDLHLLGLHTWRSHRNSGVRRDELPPKRVCERLTENSLVMQDSPAGESARAALSSPCEPLPLSRENIPRTQLI
jgi:hypothetical protein